LLHSSSPVANDRHQRRLEIDWQCCHVHWNALSRAIRAGRQQTRGLPFSVACVQIGRRSGATRCWFWPECRAQARLRSPRRLYPLESTTKSAPSGHGGSGKRYARLGRPDHTVQTGGPAGASPHDLELWRPGFDRGLAQRVSRSIETRRKGGLRAAATTSVRPRTRPAAVVGTRPVPLRGGCLRDLKEVQIHGRLNWRKTFGLHYGRIWPPSFSTDASWTAISCLCPRPWPCHRRFSADP